MFGENPSGGVAIDQRSAGEDSGQQGADGAADAVHRKGVEGVIETPVHLELHRCVAAGRGDRPDRHASPWGDESCGGGHANQPSNCSGGHAHSGGFGVAPGLHQGPGHQAGGRRHVGGGEGQFRPANGELAAAVESEPAEPQQPCAQDDLGHVMGRPG